MLGANYNALLLFSASNTCIERQNLEYTTVVWDAYRQSHRCNLSSTDGDVKLDSEKKEIIGRNSLTKISSAKQVRRQTHRLSMFILILATIMTAA